MQDAGFTAGRPRARCPWEARAGRPRHDWVRHRGDDAAGDDARRYRRRDEPCRSTGQVSRRQTDPAAHRWADHSDHRRRARGPAQPRERGREGPLLNGLPEGDPRSRPRRLGYRPAAQPAGHQHHGAGRLDQRQARLGRRHGARGAKPARHGPLRGPRSHRRVVPPGEPARRDSRIHP